MGFEGFVVLFIGKSTTNGGFHGRIHSKNHGFKRGNPLISTVNLEVLPSSWETPSINGGTSIYKSRNMGKFLILMFHCHVFGRLHLQFPRQPLYPISTAACQTAGGKPSTNKHRVTSNFGARINLRDFSHHPVMSGIPPEKPRGANPISRH